VFDGGDAVYKYEVLPVGMNHDVNVYVPDCNVMVVGVEIVPPLIARGGIPEFENITKPAAADGVTSTVRGRSFPAVPIIVDGLSFTAVAVFVIGGG
jgi:hypothetical protein